MGIYVNGVATQVAGVPIGLVPGAPTGAAGGVLTGTYPNPGLAASSVTNSQLATNAVSAGKILAGALTAPATTYTPATPANWASTAPAVVQDGLDRIAAAVETLRGSAIP